MKAQVKKNTDEKNKSFNLIGQGGYGCTYYPEIKCKTQQPGSINYLTKIQIKDKNFENETSIGKIVKTIPNYQYMFAPILDYCDVNLAKIENDKLEACDVINENPQTKFVSNKILYIGKNNLSDYFDEILFNKKNRKTQLTRYIKKIAETHLYLLDSIDILNKKDVLHLDLKVYNVMYDYKNNVPIIIDFGLSTQIKNMYPEKYIYSKRPFGVLSEIYAPWCIEIILLSYIARQVKQTDNSKRDKGYLDETKFQEKITKVDEMEKWCHLFVTQNSGLKYSIFTSSELTDFETRLKLWVNTFKNKTWKDVWSIIFSSHKSWDNYSLSMMYLSEFQNTGILDNILRPQQLQPDQKQQQQPQQPKQPVSDLNIRETSVIKKYVNILKETLLADPSKRKTPNVTFTDIKPIFNRIIKSELISTIQEIKGKIATTQNEIKVKTVKQQKTLKDLQQSKQILDNKQLRQ